MEEQLRDDEIEIDLLEIFHALWRKAWLIILCLIGGAVIAGAATKFLMVPQYTSSSMIYILTKTTSVTSLADIQMGTQLTVDFETLATSRPVVTAVIDELNLDATYEELVGTITINNPADTRILKISVENPDPELAKDIANAMADATADRVAEVMSTDKPSIVEDAVVSKRPSSPSLKKNIAIGGLLAAFLAAAVIIVMLLLDDTLKTEEDIKKYLELNTLAMIPLEEGESAVKKQHMEKSGHEKKKKKRKSGASQTHKK